MKYNFDTPLLRRGTHSLKWDLPDDPSILPMWVADMDFRTAPEITEALIKRAAHGIFGYTKIPEEYYQTLGEWFSRRHGWNIAPAWVLSTTGVVPAISSIIQALTAPGDKIILQSPVYNCFYSCIRENGREILSSPLKYENNSYQMDWDALEQAAADPSARLFLLCNPHNPAGRVWTKEELQQAAQICNKHDVLIVADEIHGEITAPSFHYTPFGTLLEEYSARSITCISPSKAFNLAGLQAAHIIVRDEALRQLIEQRLKINELSGWGVFGLEGAMAAYAYGENWLNELNSYIHQNYLLLQNFLQQELPHLQLTPLEGTYLAWINCRAAGLKSAHLANKLRTEGKLMINPGHLYGPEGEGFIRLNIACPKLLLQDGLERLKQVMQQLAPAQG